MAHLKSNRLSTALYALALLFFGMAAYQIVRLGQIALEASQLGKLDTLSVDGNAPPRLVFAKAMHLANTGKLTESIRLYASLRETEDLGLRARAMHNLAGLYLQEAAKRWNAHGVLEAAPVGTLVELAKQHYRESLRLNPDNWDARYNLEYAWRITPPPKEKPKADFQGSKSSVYSTLPGVPGGGP